VCLVRCLASASQLPASGQANGTPRSPPVPGCSALLLACNNAGTGFKEHLLGEILNLRSVWKVNLEDNHLQQQQIGNSYGDSYRDGINQGCKAGIIKTWVFLAAIATPTAHFCAPQRYFQSQLRTDIKEGRRALRVEHAPALLHRASAGTFPKHLNKSPDFIES